MSRALTEAATWTRIEQASVDGGDSRLDQMEEFALPIPCGGCGGARRYAPCAMSKAILSEVGLPAVEGHSHSGEVIFRSEQGLAPVLCESCHAFSLMSDLEAFGDGLDDNESYEPGPW